MQNIIRLRSEGERKIIPNGEPKIVAEGRIGAIVGFPVLVDEGSGYVEKTFERFMRPPGTRIIAIKNAALYLQKEYRQETASFDWRLPGGKVFDNFNEYREYLTKEIPLEYIRTGAIKELLEEAQLETKMISFLKKSVDGATVTWDLYYFVATDITEAVHEHHEGEEITEGKWFSFSEVVEMCHRGDIQEDRTVAVLLQYIASKLK